VRATDRYGDVLERILPGVEVFNFALGATGTDQQYLTFRHYAAHLEHDLIVVGVWVENILRNVSRYRTYFMPDRERTILAKPYFTFGDEGDLSLHHVPVPKHPVLPSDLSVYEGGTGSRLLRLRQAALDRLGDDAKYRLQRLARYQPLPQYDDAESPAWKLLRAILLRWGEEASVPLVVFPIPIHQYIEEMSSSTSCQARFRELHQPPKITVQDPLAEMRAFPLATRRSFRFPSDIHMTPVAHKVLAESLARAGPLRERVA